jgi:TRAP-type C4-dicarboxylate transport system permease small subunit
MTAPPRPLFDRIDATLARAETGLIFALLALAAVLNFAQVAGRYMFGLSISAFEEISVYLVIWMIFVGVTRADRLGQNIALDIAYNFVTWPTALRLSRLREVLQLVFALLMTAISAWSVLFSWQIGETSVSRLAAPVWIVMAIMPPAFLIIAVRSAVRLARGPKPNVHAEMVE